MEDRRETRPEDVTLVYLEVEAPPADAHTVDDVLADAVRRLRSQLRRGDSVGRYGNGVLALLQGARADRGQEVLDRLVESLSATAFTSPRGRLRVRASANLTKVAPGEQLDHAARRAHHP